MLSLSSSPSLHNKRCCGFGLIWVEILILCERCGGASAVFDNKLHTFFFFIFGINLEVAEFNTNRADNRGYKYYKVILGYFTLYPHIDSLLLHISIYTYMYTFETFEENSRNFSSVLSQ